MIKLKTINNKRNRDKTIKEIKRNKIKLNNKRSKALFLSKIWIWETPKGNKSKILEDLQLQRSFDYSLNYLSIYLFFNYMYNTFQLANYPLEFITKSYLTGFSIITLCFLMFFFIIFIVSLILV